MDEIHKVNYSKCDKVYRCFVLIETVSYILILYRNSKAHQAFSKSKKEFSDFIHFLI